MGGFYLDGVVFGTIRMVPMGHDLTLTETLLREAGDGVPPPGPADWEVGRLVLAPEYRSDVEALKHCLHLAVQYACVNTQVDQLYASCTHVLGRLYRRFGFSAFAKDVPLPNSDKRYTLIRGSAAAVTAGLAAGSELCEQ